MKLTISGKQISASQPFREHVEDKFKALNEKYHINPIDCLVTLEHEEHGKYHCEISAHIGRGTYIRSNSSAGEPYPCFDNTIATLEKRLLRHKKRLQDHHRKRDIHVKQQIAPSYVLNMNEEHDAHENEDLAPPIIAETKRQIQTLSVGEAVLRMDLGNETPYIFRNSSHGGINIVYKREDGNIGWVDIPQAE